MKSRKPKVSLEQLLSRTLIQPASPLQRKKLEGRRGKCIAMTRAVLDLVGMIFGRPLYTEQDYEYL